MKKKLLCFVVSLIVFQCSGMEQRFLDESVVQEYVQHAVKENESCLHVPHKPYFILFSGCPAAGKTTIAKKLQETLSLIRFDEQGAKNFLRNRGLSSPWDKAEEKIPKVMECLDSLTHHVQSSVRNKTLVLDASIDQQKPPVFNMIKTIAEKHGFLFFVIKLIVTKEQALFRVMEREKNNPEGIEIFNRYFDQYYNWYDQFRHPIHYSLDNERQENDGNLNDLTNQLKSLIS